MGKVTGVVTQSNVVQGPDAPPVADAETTDASTAGSDADRSTTAFDRPVDPGISPGYYRPSWPDRPIIGPPPPPRGDSHVDPGDVVGSLTGRDGRSQEIRVEDVHGSYDTEQEARRAAQRLSARSGGENVAVVKETNWEFVRDPGRYYPPEFLAMASSDPTQARRLWPGYGHWEAVTRYTVVTLDPAVSAEHAGDVSDIGLAGNQPGGERVVGVGNDRTWARIDYRRSGPPTPPPPKPWPPRPWPPQPPGGGWPPHPWWPPCPWHDSPRILPVQYDVYAARQTA